MTLGRWPSANAYSQAVQNPAVSFRDPALRGATPSVDRLGMPLVMSGNFAYVFKLVLPQGGARGVKCFRRPLGDRGPRFQAIDDQLDRVPIPEIARFEYEGDGILVAGRRYPVLVMEWIEGPTLDVYVGDLLRRPGAPQALRDLAAQWVQLIAKLGDAGVAHGDLQHGNVIVTPGGLRLVDLDGMFVPALRGAGAPDEVGHRHYQHPRRTVADFDERLDRFASLVIHASLLALAAEPSLWDDFHDEGLVLERRDYLDSAASPAFRRLLAQGGDAGRLADVLVRGCGQPLASLPALTSLVEAERSKLPLWLRQPVVPLVEKKTREAAREDVTPATPAPPPVPVRGVPSLAPPPRLAAVAGPAPLQWASAQMPPPPPASPAGAPPPVRPLNVPWRRVRVRQPPGGTGWVLDSPPWRAVVVVAAVFVLIAFVCSGWWLPILGPMLTGNRALQPASAILLVVGAGVALGLVVTRILGWDGTIDGLFHRSRGVRPVVARTPIVASSLLGVYHRFDCPLASRIGSRTRVWLADSVDAAARGYRACPNCRP